MASIRRALLGIAPVAITLIAALSWQAAPAGASTTKPNVMAHKGLHYPYSSSPENSTGAIDEAAALGVPVEIDILLSKPTPANPFGVPFVFHDQTLQRMTKHFGLLRDRTAADLAVMCLVTVPDREKCSPYTIPTLTTVLDNMRAAGGTLDIEIKNQTLSWGQATVIVKRLEWSRAWSWDKFPGLGFPMISSPSSQPLARIRAVAARRDDPPVLTEFLAAAKPDYGSNVDGSVMEAVDCGILTSDPQVMSKLRALGLLVASSPADQSEWPALADAGVDWVLTDNIVGYQNWASTGP